MALTLILAFQSRCRAVIGRIENTSRGPVFYHRGLALHLLRRSLPILGMTVFLAIYSSLRFSLLDIDFTRVLFHISLALLASRWGLDCLEYCDSGPPTVLRSFVSGQIKNFLRIYRVMVVFVLILALIAGRDSLTMWVARLLLSLVFLGWTAVFWLGIKRMFVQARRGGRAFPKPERIGWVKAWTYLVTGGTVFFQSDRLSHSRRDLVRRLEQNRGDSVLGLARPQCRPRMEGGSSRLHGTERRIHEYKRVPCALGVDTVCLGVLRCRPGGFHSPNLGPLRISEGMHGPFFQLHRLPWAACILRISGVLLAAAILVATRFAVRIGRTLLKEKILDKQSLERGLKDSVITITNYLGWSLGLILAPGDSGRERHFPGDGFRGA